MKQKHVRFSFFTKAFLALLFMISSLQGFSQNLFPVLSPEPFEERWPCHGLRVRVSITASPCTAICSGAAVTFTANPENGGNQPTYQWYVNNQPMPGANGAVFISNSLQDGDRVKVKLISSLPLVTGNPATSNSITIWVSDPPAAPGAISGPTEACPLIGISTPTTYSVVPVPGVSSYQWSVPTGVTIVSGQGTNSIQVLFDNTFEIDNNFFTVSTVSAGGCLSNASSLLVIKTVPGIPLAISGPTDVCSIMGTNQTATYSIAPVPGATGYNWVVSANASIVSGQGTTSIAVSFTAAYVTGSIKVTTLSNCGSRSPRSLSVTRLRPSSPVSINGPTEACPFIGTNTEVTYSVDPRPYATSYFWTLPANMQLVSGQGTTSIRVLFLNGYVSSLLKVRSVSNCFSSGDRTLRITSGAQVAPSVTINAVGGNTICAGTALVFAAVPVNGGTAPVYQWYLNGQPILDANNDSLTISTLVQGDQVYVVMQSNSTCAIAGPSQSNTISVTVNPLPPTAGGITGITEVCQLIGATTPTTYSIDPVPSSVGYTWSVPVGVTLVSGQGTTAIQVLFDNSFALTNAQIKVRTLSDQGCVGEASSLIVLKTVPGIPTAITGPTDVCSFMGQPTTATYTCTAVANASSYNWEVPANATIVSGQGSNSIEVSFSLAYTSGSIKVTALSNCGNRAPRSLSVTRLRPSSPVAIIGPTNACPFIGTNALLTYSVDPVQYAASYFWTLPANMTLISGQGTNSIQVVIEVGYTTALLKVRSVSNCFSSGDRSLSVTANNCVSVIGGGAKQVEVASHSFDVPKSQVIYPNPSKQDFSLLHQLSGSGKIGVTVTDATGRRVSQVILADQAVIRFGADLKPGVYFAKVQRGADSRIYRIIKE